MSTVYSFDTPESVAVSLPIAGIGTRFLATLLDTFFITILVIAFIILDVVGQSIGGGAGHALSAFGIIGAFVIIFGYYIFFEILWNGQTPGKRRNRIRVIQKNGYPVTAVGVIVRNIVRLVDFLPTLYAIGIVTMFIDRRARRLGDLLAGTLVVKEQRGGTLADLTYGGAAATHPSSYEALQPNESSIPSTHHPSSGSLLSAQDESLIRDFFVRQPTLPIESSETLANQIANSVSAHLGERRPLFEPAASYLLKVLAEQTAGGAALTPTEAPLRLAPADEALIRDFLRRRAWLTDERRTALARQIATAMRPRYNIGIDLNAELYLEGVIASYDRQARQEW